MITLTKTEQEVCRLFRQKRTFEQAYRRSRFRGQGNFMCYIKRLLSLGVLEEYVHFYERDGLINEHRTYLCVKRNLQNNKKI